MEGKAYKFLMPVIHPDKKDFEIIFQISELKTFVTELANLYLEKE